LDTPQRKKQASRFIILIPHRDALAPFAALRKTLFASGFPGAYSFPLAVPLAAVSRPFSRSQLQELARNIRSLTLKTGGKISNEQVTENREWPSLLTLHSSLLSVHCSPLPALDGSFFPESARGKIVSVFSPSGLCVTAADHGEGLVLPELPPVSFRAAAVANLTIQPLSGGDARYSFHWRIGTLVWLPKYKRQP